MASEDRSADRHAQVKRIFLEARERPLATREGFLVESCGDDKALLIEVQSLLLRLRDSAGPGSEVATDQAMIGSFGSIGVDGLIPSVANYRVLQKLGEGGMGEVYEAEQQSPVRRRVALKVLKGGMETREVIARFESERQALAMMNHPNISRVFEAGVTDRGRPYFAMELVHGEAITDYCDRHRLTTRERLELFVDVCAGVQHAHQKGVIHRDIKPSNVLVAVGDDLARPKIIDFGIAKATAQPLTERTLFTELGQWIGTPEYMSPEQAEMTGLDIDTRTDVYSLGVLLYELLVGARPFDSKALREAGFDEMRRRIREVEPTRPSTKVGGLGDESTIAARNRQVDVTGLVQQLRGDLDWITMKALDKDRTRRYDSPSQLAADIGRYLNDEPVTACPPSALYKASKFVRRHRLGVIAGSLVAGALVLGLVGTGLALGRAKTEAKRATQAANFLQEIFDDFNPYQNRSVASTEKVLDRAMERVETELVDQQVVQALLMRKIGVGYRHLDMFERSKLLLERSLEILRAEHGQDHPEVVETLREIGGLAYESGNYPRFLQMFEEALEIQYRIYEADDPRVADGEMELGFSLWQLGDFRGAERLLDRSLATLERASDQDEYLVSRNLFIQGVLFNNSGDYRRARLALERSLRIRLGLLGPDHVRVGWTLRTLARAQFLQGDYELALESGQRALEIMESAFGPEHSDVAFAWETLGTIHSLLGEFAEARPLLERSLSVREGALGPDHVELGFSLRKLADFHLESNDPEAAAPLIARAVALERRGRPEGHPVIALNLHVLSRQQLMTGRLEDALSSQQEALEILEAKVGADDPLLAAHLANLGVLHRETGDPVAARQLLERALDLREQQLGPAHRLIADDLCELGLLYAGIGDDSSAGRAFDRAAEMYKATVGDDHPAAARCVRGFASRLRRVG